MENTREFSIYHLIEVVDHRLCSLKPPSFISRLPRPIKTHVSYWKVSERKNWFFYFSLPGLNDILPKNYFEYFKILVLAIYTLCTENVSIENVDLAEKLLREFVSRFEHLYGIKNMTCNVHSLQHFLETVRRTGPLWTTSCFPFEDFNGKLKVLIHGSKKSHLQIVTNLSMHIRVCTLKHEWLDEESEAFNFCEKMLSPAKIKS